MRTSRCGLILATFLRLGFCGYNSSHKCPQFPSCLKCGSTGCMKCTTLILYPSRECTDSCPFGYAKRWSTSPGYMGMMCIRADTFMGFGPDFLSIFTGMLCGLILCVVVVTLSVFFLKYRRRQLTGLTIETDNNSDMEDSPEKREFLKKLEILRPHASSFLDMLNDTRRQLREVYRDGDNTAAAAYRPVVRDLAKILLLLNRPVERLPVPDDWELLFRWGEKALKRYRRMSETSQTQVTQLIDFLQSPVEEHTSRTTTSMSTFKPDQNFGSSASLQENKNLASPLNPQWQFDYPIVTNTRISLSEFMPSQWKNSKEYLNSPYFLEDDFFQLGFRPQDEITTEL